MGAGTKEVGIAATAVALVAAGGYVAYKYVKGEEIEPSSEDFKKNIANISSSNGGSEGDDRSSHENHDCDHNEFDPDGRIVFS